MGITLLKERALKFKTDGELMSWLAHADIIAVDRGDGTEPEMLWSRPIEEIEARGYPLELDELTFQVEDEETLRLLRDIVDQLKHDD